jgi:hypothetical protein
VAPGAVVSLPQTSMQVQSFGDVTWAERAYHNLIYYNQLDTGGHFAAWEQPRLFADEVRAGLRPLGNSGAESRRRSAFACPWHWRGARYARRDKCRIHTAQAVWARTSPEADLSDLVERYRSNSRAAANCSLLLQA